MSGERCDALVFFGATGDLAYKKIFPALLAMVRHGLLQVPVIGVANSPWTLAQFTKRVQDSLAAHGEVDQAAATTLIGLLRYIAGDYGDPRTFAALRAELGPRTHPTFYLAIPPSLFPQVVTGLFSAGCASGGRVVVEKPFGRDLASAQSLNRTLRSCFAESDIYRIDHYLGKEAVQNLVYFRFANQMVEAGWSNHHIESMQITMAESFGVAGRGAFYEETGAIRDVVQNHMLQVIASLTMECPARQDHEALRDERARLLKSVRSLRPEDVLRGQFTGYRAEPGVAPGSTVETFAVARFFIDNPRWQGVPIFVRVGKCLPVTATEAVVRFRVPTRGVLDDAGSGPAGYCRFRISPDVVLALAARVKKAGQAMTGEPIELIAHHQPPEEMEAYERLLHDASMGDATLFARADAVEESWRVVAAALDTHLPLLEYAPGSWGPVQPSLTPPGGWFDPRPEGRDPGH